MRLPFQREQPLPPDRAEAFAAVAKLLAGDTPHGYLRAWTASGQRFLFFLQGKLHSAGTLQGDEFVAATIRDSVAALANMHQAKFYATDVALLLCLAVPFRKAPAAQVPASLVDPHMLLESIRKTETDAVLVVRRSDARNVAFCRNGEPQALYTAGGEVFPGDGPIADRIVEYVFSDAPGEVSLDIYDQIRLPPAADAGRPLASYLEDDASEALPTLTLIVKLGERVVFQYPMTTAEIVVGRALEADLVLDNLSVSRQHAKIQRRPNGTLVVDDLGGKNGLKQAGTRVKQAVLSPGGGVGIGKYRLEYRAAAPDQNAPSRRSNPDQMAAIQETMLVEPSSGLAIRFGDRDYKLRMILSVGSTEAANVVIRGWWIAPLHVQIIRDEQGDYLAMHIAGRRAMRVNGEKTKKATLKLGDRIKVGRNELVVIRSEDS
ncbi:MAG: FHA domain-containing protein [Myxococcota bacterium]